MKTDSSDSTSESKLEATNLQTETLSTFWEYFDEVLQKRS